MIRGETGGRRGGYMVGTTRAAAFVNFGEGGYFTGCKGLTVET